LAPGGILGKHPFFDENGRVNNAKMTLEAIEILKVEQLR
jgi:hypothetical protein